jgi:DNA polymerase-3 subunit delta
LLRVLTGGDDYSIRQVLEEIKRGMGEPTMLAANTAILNGRQLTIDQMRGACETVPFLTPKRLVIIEGLLERFETRAKTGGKKAASRTIPENDYKSIAVYLSHVPDFTEVVLVDGGLDKNNPLLRELAAVAEVKTFPLLNEGRLRQWIEHRVTEDGGSISRQAVDQLVRFVGNDLWVMAGEVDKLVLYVSGRLIEEADVRAVVSYTQEANVFAMVDAILEFKAGVAQGLLQQLFKQGAAPAYLLVMLARQVRLIFLASSLAGQKLSRKEIQNRLGLFSDFFLNKVLGQSGKYSMSRLKEVYHKLLEADLSVKTGGYDGELALNILIAELGQKDAAREAVNRPGR